MAIRHDPVSRAARLLMILALGLSWCAGPQLSRGQAPSGGSSVPAEPTPQDLDQLATHLERACAALEEAGKKIPSDTFDLDAIVKLTDGDPARIFAWVRDKTFWVPYRGEL